MAPETRTPTESGRPFLGWTMVALAFALYGFGMAPAYYAWGFLAPEIIADVGLSREQIGSTFGLFPLSFALTSPVAGVAIDRIGLRPVLALGAFLGAAGFAWDQDIFAGAPELRYGQWRSWMAILKAIRAAKPDAVMDHRQTNHVWGPWYQLAGSYAKPLAGDENPETYGVPIANLHADHVAADNLRRVNYAYAAAQLLPPSRVPGFIFHQAERTDDNGTDACFGGVPWREAASGRGPVRATLRPGRRRIVR